MIPVKICGITRREDAIIAERSGVAAVGFIFHEPSPRYIQPKVLNEWVHTLPKYLKKVGVFVDKDVDKVNKIAADINLDIVQLHGNEAPEYCNDISLPIIKVFRVHDAFRPDDLVPYSVSAFLFDTYRKGWPGGTGDIFDWSLLKDIHRDIPVILSGGINVENLKEAISQICPSAIDVNSGVEKKPGIKDEEKIQQLMSHIKKLYSNSDKFWSFEEIKV